MFLHDFVIVIMILIASFFLMERIYEPPAGKSGSFHRHAGFGAAIGIISIILMGYSVYAHGTNWLFYHIPLMMTALYGGIVPLLAATLLTIVSRFVWYGFHEQAIASAIVTILLAGLHILIVKRHPNTNIRSYFWKINAAGSVFLSMGMLLYLTKHGAEKSYIAAEVLGFLGSSLLAGWITFHIITYMRQNKVNYQKIQIQNTSLGEQKAVLELQKQEIHLQREQILQQRNLLQESKEQIFDVLESISDSFFALDANWKFVYINETAKTLFNQLQKDLIGKIYWEEFPFLIGGELYTKYHIAMNQRKRIEFEYHSTMFNKDFLIRVFPSRNGIFIYYQDITIQKTAQEELRLTKESYQDILESVQEVIFQTDENGIWTFLNPAWQNIFGYSPQESLGYSWSAYVHPEDRETALAGIQESIRQMKSSHQLQCRYVTRQGEIYWVEVFLRFRWGEGRTFAGAYGTLIDITKRVNAEEQAKRVVRNLKDLNYALEESSILAVTNAKRIITYVNQKFCDISQYSQEELIGNTHRIVNSSHHSPPFFHDMWAAIHSGRVWKGEIQNRRKDGSTYWVDTTIVPIFDENDNILQYVSIRNDITARKLAEQQLLELNRSLAELSSRDGLTGIYNRRHFDEALDKEWKRACRTRQPLGLILFDIDHFKLYNDHYGHQQGDACLQQVAQVLQEGLYRAADIGARYGGEEFVMVLPDTDLQGTRLVAERVRECLEALEIPHLRSQVSSVVTGSFGVASLVPTEADAAHELVAQADQALYLAKRSGRNKVACYGEIIAISSSIPAEPSPHGSVQQYIDVLHARDKDTWEHSNRVAHYALLLAAQLGLNENQREIVFLAALLHDIGKLDLPESILKKPGRLTEEEFEIVRQHPQLGWEKLARHKALGVNPEILNGALYHHERWDGTGYPNGLGGENIPYIARLIGVADSFAAMTEQRVYKLGMTEEQALVELIQNSGKQFDPDMVAAFARVFSPENSYSSLQIS